MSNQEMPAVRRHDRPGELREVAVEQSRSRTVRQQHRALRAALTVPVQAPHRQSARDEVANRFEVFLDEFRKAADEYTIGARRRRREVPPTQCNPIGRGERPPLEAGWFEETPFEGRRHIDDKGSRRKAPMVAPVSSIGDRVYRPSPGSGLTPV